ncbi:hypothetical protein [Actinomadura alba]|uniref:Uncharacterized protein n=1 Tax=Actinomadura alba TaxID=406431 RepID=A0ABR7M1P6_9ACTN|nr:hypothetical protein [Actinomadura alba]MBC6470961.1 hypothetical protein [Actinomadura alba]
MAAAAQNDPDGLRDALDRMEGIAPAPGPLVDLLTTMKAQMEVAATALYEQGVTAADLAPVADYLCELVEHGQELAVRAFLLVQDAPLPIRGHENFGDVEIYLRHSEQLLSVAITTTSEASMYVNRMNLDEDRRPH